MEAPVEAPVEAPAEAPAEASASRVAGEEVPLLVRTVVVAGRSLSTHQSAVVAIREAGRGDVPVVEGDGNSLVAAQAVAQTASMVGEGGSMGALSCLVEGSMRHSRVEDTGVDVEVDLAGDIA